MLEGFAHYLKKGVTHPIHSARFGWNLTNNKFQITEKAKVFGRGERVVVDDWQSVKEKGEMYVWCHIQRYEWVLSFLQGLHCLDAGCGSGYGTHFLANNGVCEIVGIDISKRVIKFGRNRYQSPNLEFLQMNVQNIKFEDDSFDAVITFDVLEHLGKEGQEMFLSEIARVLKKDGTAYISCPNASLSKGTNPFHLRELTVIEFKELLGGFFDDIKTFGQKISIPGFTENEDWREQVFTISYTDLTIVEDSFNEALGLLAICKNPKGRTVNGPGL